MSLELKVKVMSLAEESRIIRKQEQKTNGFQREHLHYHRVIVVRRAARDSNIAYAMCRGRSYKQIEPKTREDKMGPRWPEIKKMLIKYGPEGIEENIPK